MAGHLPSGLHRDDRLLRRAKQPEQHVEKVDADVDRKTARPFFRSLPGDIVPAASRSHVREINLMSLAGRLGAQARFQFQNNRMMPKLQDGIDPLSGFALELLKGVEIPGVDDERFFTKAAFRAHAKRQPDVRVVQVVRRADADEMDAPAFGAATKLLKVPIETFEFGEESDVVPNPIEKAKPAAGRGPRRGAGPLPERRQKGGGRQETTPAPPNDKKFRGF